MTDNGHPLQSQQRGTAIFRIINDFRKSFESLFRKKRTDFREQTGIEQFTLQDMRQGRT